jgi:hypothetical protein
MVTQLGLWRAERQRQDRVHASAGIGTTLYLGPCQNRGAYRVHARSGPRTPARGMAHAVPPRARMAHARALTHAR